MDIAHNIGGTVWAVFGHRFAVEGPQGRLLADLGPRGADGIVLRVGDAVVFTGERKPSEIKVASLTLADGTVRSIDWTKKPHHPHKGEHDRDAPADPAAALAAVRREGYAIEGEPKRKPKHFEIVGSKDGALHTVHVELDGRIRKTKPMDATAS